MGWWKTGNHDDVMGDTPADFLGEMLVEVAQNYEQRIQRKPTWKELLEGMATALCIRPEGIYENASYIIVKAIAIETIEGRFTSYRSCGVDGAIVNKLRDVLGYIADAYENVKDRKPRLSELTSCLRFVLGANTDLYLSDPETASGRTILIETEEIDVSMQ